RLRSSRRRPRIIELYLRDKVKHLEEEVRRIRKEDIRIAADAEWDQGRRLHEALSGEEPRKLFDKLPEGSLARAVVDEMMNYNEFQRSSKGWRFSPKVLRWALYALAKMGSAGYNVIQDVLHLLAAAGTTRLGVQHHLVEAYGKMAAEDNLGRFDLCGILVWDLMHLNTNGFKVRPNGGGIQGLVDPDSILRHPLDGVKGVAENISLEEILETFVATQYPEVFWVSIGNPKYE
ncbi:unnamed protein product, partial [Pylaiella littoralis]